MKKYEIEQRTFEASDGANISYKVLGDPANPHVLLIHGWGCTSDYWRPQFPLSEDLYLVVPDLRGYGASERKGPYSISRMVVDMLDLARREGVSVVVGHSMGGVIAQQLAANFPDLFDVVVLASTFARLGSPIAVKFFERALPLINKIDLRSFARFAISFTYNIDKRERLRLYRMYRHCDKDVLIENAKEILSYDGTWNLPAIDAPTLIIHGDHDPVVPPTHASYIADHVPDAHVMFVREAGHEVNYNDPDLFNSAVLGFISYHL